MTELERTDDTPQRKRKWKTVIVILGALCIGVWFFSPTGGINRPVKLEKGNDGQLQVVGNDSGGEGLTLKAHAGVVNAQNSTSIASSTSHSDPGWFSANSLTILNQSDHLLMKRVGESLLENLKAQSNWQQVQYLPAGYSIDRETPASDLYMTINLVDIQKSGMLQGNLNAEITASIGNGLTDSRHSVHDSLSSIMVQFHANVNLNHESTLTGVESAGARYSLQGAEIAKELAKVLQKQVEGIREKYSFPPQEIQKLLAKYRPTPDLASLADKELIATTYGIMVHNDTLWSLKIDGNPGDFIRNSSDALQQQGWSEYSKQVEDDRKYLRMKDETKWLEIFPQSNSFSPLSHTTNETTDRWYVRYQERMSRSELEKFVQTLLDEEPLDIDLLLALDRLASSDQRDQVYELAITNSPTSAAGWLRLASWYAHKKEMNKAIEAMQSATVMSLLMEDRSDVKKKVENLIKKHKLDKKSVLDLKLAQFENAGVQLLTNDFPKAEKRFQAGQSVAFAISGESSEKWTYFGARVSDAKDEKYRLAFFKGNQYGGHGHSSTCCIDLDHERRHEIGAEDQRALLKINKLEEGKFEAQAELVKD